MSQSPRRRNWHNDNIYKATIDYGDLPSGGLDGWNGHWAWWLIDSGKDGVDMKDAFHKEVNVGDKVVYIKKVAGYGSKVLLAKGTVKGIKGRIIKVTGHSYGVMSQSVMKIEK